MVGVQGKQVSKVYGLYGMLDYQALSVTNESHAFILTSRLNGWCPRFCCCCCCCCFCFVLFIYLFNNLAIEVTVELGKLIKCPPRFTTLLPIWPLLLVEI